MKRILHKHYLILSISLFYFVIAILTPLVHDDLEWGLTYGTDMLKTFYAELNGRYLGNTLEVIAVRIPLFRYITYTFFSVAMILVCARLIKDFIPNLQCRAFNIIAIFMFLVLMPISLYSQIYGWFAGLYNYVPASLCSLILVRYSLKILNDEPLRRQEQWLILSCALLGQWFMENHTIFNVILLMGLLIIKCIQTRKIPIFVFLALGFSILGAIAMFINPNYIAMFAGDTSCQQVSDDNKGMIVKVVGTLFTQFPQYLVYQPMFLIMLLVIVLSVLLYQSRLSRKFKYTLIPILFIAPLYHYIVRVPFNFAKNNQNIVEAIFDTVIIVMLFSALCLAIYKVIDNTLLRQKLLILLSTIPIIVAPLLAVEPMGPRNFYIVYIISLIMLISLVNVIHFRPYRLVKWVSIVGASCLIIVFSIISIAQYERIIQVKEVVKTDDTVTQYTIQHLPFESYMQHATPYNHKTVTIFKEYWEIPEDITLSFIDDEF